PDGTRVLAAYGDGVRVWDLKERKLLRRFEGHGGPVGSVVISPDGTLAFSGGIHDHNVRVWNIETSKEIHCLKGHAEQIVQIAVSPDGRRVLSGGIPQNWKDFSLDMTMRLWDVVEGKQLAVLDAPASCGFVFLD